MIYLNKPAIKFKVQRKGSFTGTPSVELDFENDDHEYNVVMDKLLVKERVVDFEKYLEELVSDIKTACPNNLPIPVLIFKNIHNHLKVYKEEMKKIIEFCGYESDVVSLHVDYRYNITDIRDVLDKNSYVVIEYNLSMDYESSSGGVGIIYQSDAFTEEFFELLDYVTVTIEAAEDFNILSNFIESNSIKDTYKIWINAVTTSEGSMTVDDFVNCAEVYGYNVCFPF